MNRLRIIPVSLLLVLAVSLAQAQTADDVQLTVTRLSDRTVVVTEDIMENNIVAVASSKGLIVFDTSGSPTVAARVREVFEKELGSSDFAYVVNTHHHWDHSFGNFVFSGAEIVGHEGCPARVRRDEEGLPLRIDGLRRDIEETAAELAELDSNSEEARDLQKRLATRKRMLADYSDKMVFAPPTITFSDRLTLDLGDLTLKLFYFGRAHSGTDIVIFIPEEGLLMTGDLFLDGGWLPLFAGMSELDVPRWIEVLGAVLDGEDEVRTVIPGHQHLWTRERLMLWRDYIVDLWEEIRTADAEGVDLETVEARFPLNEEFDYLKDLGHDDAELEQYHARNVRAFWRQIKESAAAEIDRTIAESGAAAGVDRFRELRSQPENRYFFDEAAFNSLGYRIMGEEKIEEAIEIFKMNVEMFPESWNVYDSLGEAYLTRGDRDSAIKNYRKSLELNPENENGREVLGELLEGDG